MSDHRVRLSSGYYLHTSTPHTRRGLRPDCEHSAMVLRRSIGDPNSMIELRRLCATWISPHRLSDQDIVAYVSYRIEDGSIALDHDKSAIGSMPASIARVAASMAGTKTERRGKVSELSLSEDAKTLLKWIEELRLKPYNDQNGKDTTVWVEGATIGYGHLIGAEANWPKYKAGITNAAADLLFESDSWVVIAHVQSAITAEVMQREFDALVIFAYNMSPKAFRESSAVAFVNNPKAKTNYKDLESAWKAFNKSQGKVNKGLINRRKCEWDIYTKGVYKRW